MLGRRPGNPAPRPGVPTPVIGDDPAGSGQITDQGPPGGGGRSGRGDQQDRRPIALLLVVEVASPGPDEPHSLNPPHWPASAGAPVRSSITCQTSLSSWFSFQMP